MVVVDEFEFLDNKEGIVGREVVGCRSLGEGVVVCKGKKEFIMIDEMG